MQNTPQQGTCSNPANVGLHNQTTAAEPFNRRTAAPDNTNQRWWNTKPKTENSHNRAKKETPKPTLLLSCKRRRLPATPLLYSLDSQTIKPIARQNIKKSPDIKKMQMKNEFSVSRFRFHPNKSETVPWKENENKSRATSKWKRTPHKNSTCA